MENAVYFVICSLPIIFLLTGVIIALGKRPGLRRRNKDIRYDGIERRCPKRQTCEKSETCAVEPTECPIEFKQTPKND